MANSQTVSNHVKNRLVIGTIVIWGSVIFAIGTVLNEYFSTGHFILLLTAGIMVAICAVSLVMVIFILPVLGGLETLELWISDAAKGEVGHPIPLSPGHSKLIEPIYRSYNALAARLKADSYQRVQFVERLAHDMRASLASIQGYAEVLQDYNIGVEGTSLQTYGKIIANQTYRLGKMIEDARTASCISDDFLRIEFESVRPCVLLDVLVTEARKNNVREIRYQNDLGECIIAGDAYLLRDMIIKLIDNALSFSHSYISIQALVENGQAGSWAKIIVEDHGSGFSETELNTLFRPFDPPKDRKTSPIFHSSLSFYIIKAIVDGHKGKLMVQSQPGQGTTYTINLPVQKVKE